jgi:hypothetical protein
VITYISEEHSVSIFRFKRIRVRMLLGYIGRLSELEGHVLSEQVMQTVLPDGTNEEEGSLQRQDSNFLLR